jgi:cell division protein FtsZ
VEAAKAAINSPLLEVAIDGAKGILFIVSGSSNLGMHEVSEAAQIITGKADPGAKIIFGTVIDDSLKDEMKITVVATGFDGIANPAPRHANGGFYTPSSFLKSQEPALAESMANAKDKKLKNKKEEERANAGDGELEIPAFLRKKLL